jgi:vacuolar-type H+-ATPase subunit E/Vma4
VRARLARQLGDRVGDVASARQLGNLPQPLVGLKRLVRQPLDQPVGLELVVLSEQLDVRVVEQLARRVHRHDGQEWIRHCSRTSSSRRSSSLTARVASPRSGRSLRSSSVISCERGLYV